MTTEENSPPPPAATAAAPATTAAPAGGNSQLIPLERREGVRGVLLRAQRAYQVATKTTTTTTTTAPPVVATAAAALTAPATPAAIAIANDLHFQRAPEATTNNAFVGECFLSFQN